MGLTNFDELNTLSKTETTKDDRQKTTRKKIPIHDYFENMQISEEEKSRSSLSVRNISKEIFVIGEKGNRAGSENAAIYPESV